MRNKFFKVFIFLFLVSFWLGSAPVLASRDLAVGTLIKNVDRAEVFIYQEDGLLHWIPDEATFNSLGFDWSKIVTFEDEFFLNYSFGETLKSLAPTTTEPKILTVAATEQMVREYFADIPEMIPVAKCESSFRQFNDDGSYLVGHGLYIGIFQIAEKIHAEYAKSLGMDIYTAEGNMAYARRLYESSGLKPWPTCSVTTSPLRSDLKLGDSNAEVIILQQMLNKAGFPVASSGPGSAGNETEYFGSLTQTAVRRFQCAKGIVCSGSEITTGYGLVGPKTRAALIKY